IPSPCRSERGVGGGEEAPTLRSPDPRLLRPESPILPPTRPRDGLCPLRGERRANTPAESSRGCPAVLGAARHPRDCARLLLDGRRVGGIRFARYRPFPPDRPSGGPHDIASFHSFTTYRARRRDERVPVHGG